MTASDLVPSRAQWAKFIRETSNVARYIWPSGTILANSTAPDENDIRDFLDKVRSHDQAASLLGIGYYISLPDVRQFLLVDLPLLVRHLGHSSVATSPEVASAIRGKVAWPGTILGRLSGQVPRGQYLVRSSERQLDTPENQLLKRYLVDLVDGLTALATATGSRGTAKIIEAWDAVLTALSSPYLQSVSLVGRSTALMVARARRNKNARYGRLAKLSERLRTLRGHGKWSAIADLLAAGWMAPVADDDLFELFCLVSILDVLEKELGFGAPKEYDLIWRGRRHVALFDNGNVEVTVVFNLSPARLFGVKTRFKAFSDEHTFYNVGPRRPDIILIFRSGTIERRFLVEAKDTVDPKYARDSLYKVFGYIYDFHQIWLNVCQAGLKAVMVVPDRVSFMGGPNHSREVVAVSANDRSGLAEVLDMMRRSVLDQAAIN